MNHRYTSTSIALHWAMALGLAGTFALGFYMADLSLSPTKLKLYSYHKWAGITLLLFALARLAWRVGHSAPELPEGMPAIQRLAAHAAHWVLYGLMLGIPLSGWLMSSAQGFPVVWFGLVPLPDLVAKNKELGVVLGQIHVILNYCLLAVVLVHIVAALKHHFIDNDGLLGRMLPWIKR